MSTGQSVFIKGTISAAENLEIAGQVEGTIDVRDHVLTIASEAKVFASVSAKSVSVAGALTGEVRATDRIEVRRNGSVEGDVSAPRVAMEEGAVFHGRIDMPARPAA
ncbi:MAG TPA: polymer-forming cytoskeletal protein [Vicinamibacterales bacterium]|jgi:cytoskeletal protein CcmA (bactofilin family)